MKDTSPTRVRLLELRPNQALALDAAPGTIVRSLQGTIWLTQEAVFGDCILIAGTRFVSASRGKIVLSAIDGPSTVRVYEPGCGSRHEYGAGLQVDSGVIARIEREARHARNQEIERLVRKLGAFVASAWRHVKGESPKTRGERSPAACG